MNAGRGVMSDRGLDSLASYLCIRRLCTAFVHSSTGAHLLTRIPRDGPCRILSWCSVVPSIRHGTARTVRVGQAVSGLMVALWVFVRSLRPLRTVPPSLASHLRGVLSLHLTSPHPVSPTLSFFFSHRCYVGAISRSLPVASCA